MKHVTVYGEQGIYAGWPANHGSWQWGDEFLVGFIRGKHFIGGMHNIRGDLEKVQARSLDGGETWRLEKPNVDFACEDVGPAPAFNIRTSIIRVCGGYDHGGDDCCSEGGFYLSHDRGVTWTGAFSFGVSMTGGSGGLMNTSRTCVLDDLVFLSIRNRDHWGTDFVECQTHDGSQFIPKSIVLNDDARAVMPAAAKVGNRMVVVMRRLGRGRLDGWIDSVFSDDGGETWSIPLHVGETGKDNGNPPAIVEAGGKVYCAYADRSEHTVNVMVSEDGAYSWKAHALLRKGGAPDIGYPRLFKRNDGRLVCVYYWTDDYEMPQRIEATIFEP